MDDDWAMYNLYSNTLFLSTVGDTSATPAGGGAAQTYIVAQNPLVLAHLLRENQARAIHPQAYTTPASVFNTVSVDFAETLPETHVVDKIIHPRPDEKIDIPLHTAPIPAASLQKLDPIVPAPTPSDPPDETLTVVVGVRESCDNLCQNVPSLSPRDTASPSPAVEPEVSESYASRVRSLERNTRGTLSSAERAPIRMGSLERNARGSLSHRGSPVPIAPFTRQHSVPASPPPRTRRDQDIGQFAVQGALNAQLAASVMNKMRTQPEPALVEEIYDFGGENVKSCVAIAAQRAMARPQYRRESSMAASHPSAYGVPVGVVQGVPYSPGQSRPSKVPPGFLRSASPQPFSPGQGFASQPMGVVPPMSYGGQQIYTHGVSGAQPMMYRAQAGSSQAPQLAGPPFRPALAQPADASVIFASRMECQPAASAAPVVPAATGAPPAAVSVAPSVVPVHGAVPGVSAGVSHVHGVAQPVQVTGLFA